jgi:hypothetical protein
MRRASTKKEGRGRVIKSTGSEVGRRAFLLKRPTMSIPSELRVEVLGDEIIVILPATSYGVTYSKPGNSPNLVAKNCVPKVDSGAPMTHVEFLAKAWLAANVKARELGWIA